MTGLSSTGGHSFCSEVAFTWDPEPQITVQFMGLKLHHAHPATTGLLLFPTGL